MKPMPMICPGEADVIHNFITRAKPPLQKWLREHCPVNYWTSSAQVYEKAIQFGTNHDPTLTRALAGPKLLGAMSVKPQSSYRSGTRDSNHRSSNPRRNANRTYQPTRRFHTGGWPVLHPSASAQQGEFTMVQAKKHKPALDMDRPTYKGLVQKAIKDRSITYTAFEQQRMSNGECPCCGKQHLLIGCDPVFGGPFLLKKGVVPP
jgi:hypothetical protein